MSLSVFLLLIFMSFGSGLSAVYLGVGGSLIIVPLLPMITGLSALETLQLSLALIFVISFINASIFLMKGLVIWSWVFPLMIAGTVLSFSSSFLVPYLSNQEIRFILLIFLSAMLFIPFLLKRIEFIKTPKGSYIFGSLMGLCVGLTGLGGGFIISPYLHETRRIPPKNVSPIACVAMFLTCFLAVVSQSLATDFPYGNNSFWWQCYFIMLASSIVGVFVGYFLNEKDKNLHRRRWILRGVVVIMFCKVFAELIT